MRTNEELQQDLGQTGKAPKEWTPVKLSSCLIGRPKNGYSPKEVDEWTGKLMLGLGCLTADGYKPNQLKNAPSNNPQFDRALLHDGDLLISRANTRELVGLVGIYKSTGYPCIYPDLMMRLTPRSHVFPEFLELVLRSNSVRRQIKAQASGTSGSMVKINSNIVMGINVNLPPLSEQRFILEILDTLDDTIQATEQLIAKLKQMKQGLLHDLLTRGINENGELRDPERHPEQFKDSPLGRIPTEWEISALGNVGRLVTGNTPPSSRQDSWGDSLPFITPADITADGELLDSSRKLSAQGVRCVRPLPKNSILVVCIGSTIGKIAFADFACATNQQINAVIPEGDSHPKFLYSAIRSQIRQLFALSGLQAVPIVNKRMFGTVRIALAPPLEQHEIAKRVSSTEDRLSTETQLLQKLKITKKGLMDDLLTGKVRVTKLKEGQQ